MRKLEVGTQSLKEMGADILKARKRAEGGQEVALREALYFTDMPLLLSQVSRDNHLIYKRVKNR